MKTVFVPASDEILSDKTLDDSTFVPFQPAYLTPKRDRKPRNWVTQSSYQDAMARLKALGTGAPAH